MYGVQGIKIKRRKKKEKIAIIVTISSIYINKIQRKKKII